MTDSTQTQDQSFTHITSATVPPSGGEQAPVSASLFTPLRTSTVVVTTTVAPSPSPPTALSGKGVHGNGHLAGAAVGSFFAGLLLSAAAFLLAIHLKRRKEHQRLRDQQIQSAFMANIGQDGKAVEEIALTSTRDKLLPSVSHSEPTHTAAHGASPGADPVWNITSDPLPLPKLPGRSSHSTSTDLERSATTMKRQSFPEALLVGRPRRHMSISAAGLISPVAASHPTADRSTLEQLIKHLGMEATLFFEQITMHVDNFYQDRLPADPPFLTGPQQEKG